MNRTRPDSPEPLLNALVVAGVTFQVARIDRDRFEPGATGRPPTVRCQIGHEPGNLNRAAEVLRRHGLRRTGAQLGRGAWTYDTRANYRFVITGRPTSRIADSRPPVARQREHDLSR